MQQIPTRKQAHNRQEWLAHDTWTLVDNLIAVMVLTDPERKRLRSTIFSAIWDDLSSASLKASLEAAI